MDTRIEIAGVTKEFTLRHRRSLKELVVAEGHRDGNIRTELLKWAEDRAREAGCESVAITSRLDHQESHDFYETHGFEKSHYRFDKPLD